MEAARAAWYLPGDGNQAAGPFTDEQVFGKYRSGELDESTLCWREGMLDWLPLTEAEPFATAIRKRSTMLRFLCPVGHEIIADRSLVGRKLRCRKCNCIVTVPDEAGEDASASAATTWPDPGQADRSDVAGAQGSKVFGIAGFAGGVVFVGAIAVALALALRDTSRKSASGGGAGQPALTIARVTVSEATQMAGPFGNAPNYKLIAEVRNVGKTPVELLYDLYRDEENAQDEIENFENLQRFEHGDSAPLKPFPWTLSLETQMGPVHGPTEPEASWVKPSGMYWWYRERATSTPEASVRSTVLVPLHA